MTLFTSVRTLEMNPTWAQHEVQAGQADKLMRAPSKSKSKGKARQSKMTQRHLKARQGRAGQSKAGQGRAKQGRAGQSKAGQGKVCS